MNIVSLGYADF
uniref:Uncharacterized protein n=1 Tax=Rhizophora mucronata TaxID=61149 RepID=A0A2P2Q1K2_RHIMU